MTVMMRCGHAANATDENGNPSCVICVGIVPGATVVDEPPDLTGRRAKCPDCDLFVDSETSLAFFEHRPNKDFDMYYCGCSGWN